MRVTEFVFRLRQRQATTGDNACTAFRDLLQLPLCFLSTKIIYLLF